MNGYPDIVIRQLFLRFFDSVSTESFSKSSEEKLCHCISKQKRKTLKREFLQGKYAYKGAGRV